MEKLDISKTPKVSVILTTYSRPKTVGRAIQSIIDQTLSDWELIVIDDASIDETAEVLKGWAESDKRIHVVRNEKNLFLPASLDRGLGLARAEFVARLDDDDYWIDRAKLQKQVDFLNTHPDCVVVGGGVIVVDGSGKELFRYFKKETDAEIRKKALFANPFSHTTVMFRANAARKVGGYGSERYAEDWGLWLRMGMVGTFYNFQEYFTAYTMDGTNGSFIYQRPQTRRILGFIKKHRNDYPGFLEAYILNSVQYVFSFLPSWLRLWLHSFLSSVKRRSF